MSDSSTTGKLTAVSPYNPAGSSFQNGTTAIGHPTNGSSKCDIIINGGVIDVRGSGIYPGIQGKNVTINGGYVKATVDYSKKESPYPSGINGQNVTISGGTVNATGGLNGAGIGGGSGGSGGTINISGGNVTAKGGDYGAGIGGVYGDQTLSSAFEVKSGETLLIAEGATLTTNSNLTNNGTIYVDGTLSGTVSGKVYYRLSLTNCTASGDTSNY